jgi:hypothetical protein
MEIKLNIYKTKGKMKILTSEVERTAVAKDFELSTGICEDVLNIINIDMFDGGLKNLSNDSLFELAVGWVKNGYPYFIELVKEIFDITDDESQRLKLGEVAQVVVDIVKYSFSNLTFALGSKEKN